MSDTKCRAGLNVDAVVLKNCGRYFVERRRDESSRVDAALVWIEKLPRLVSVCPSLAYRVTGLTGKMTAAKTVCPTRTRHH